MKHYTRTVWLASLGWIDTNLKRGNCDSNTCGSRVILSLGKRF